MEFQFTPDQEEFRIQVQDFIANSWTPPPFDSRPGDDASHAADSSYEAKLAENGWLTMAWPEEYGGLGASHMQQLIFREESAAACLLDARRRSTIDPSAANRGPKSRQADASLEGEPSKSCRKALPRPPLPIDERAHTFLYKEIDRGRQPFS